MKQLVGTGVALVTPFHQDYTVDEQALARIVNYCITGGIDYLVVLGTTGESVTLNAAEKRQVIDTVIRANDNRLPLVLGIGGNNTAALVVELQQTDVSAFDAILSVSPYYNRPTQEGIYQHFKALSQASPLPIILYNVPSRTGSNMIPETVIRLANDFKNIVAIKEASGAIVQVEELIRNKPKDLLVISGDDATALATVEAGGSGVISVLGQGLPNEFSKMIRAGLEGDIDTAKKIEGTLEKGMSLIFEEGNPAGIKAIFELMGLATAQVRLPLVEATAALKVKLGAFIRPFSQVHG